MRLVCGILRLDGTLAGEAELTAMAGAMTGPGLSPAVDRWLDGPVGLAVLDFAGTGRKIEARDGWVLAADARLDRYLPERSSAAIIEAVALHGADFPDRLDGDFAVALWRSDRQEILLGRDFIGARPLVWTWQPGRWFAFASLPKGLHGSRLAAADIDPAAVGAKLSQFYFSGASSGFAEISCLQAGHSLTVRPDDSVPPRPYRAYRPDPAAVGRWRGTPDEAAATLRHLVEEAVAARLPASGHAAAHLTGGLDSSAITVLAAREMRRRGGRLLAVGTSAYGDEDLDQGPMIQAVLDQERDLDHVLVAGALPMPGMPQEPDWPGRVLGDDDDLMSAAAASFGATVLLSGVGGDEGASYNGANLYARLLREGHLRTLWRELPVRARDDGMPVTKAIRNRLLWPLLPSGLRRAIWRWRGRPRPFDPRHGIARYLKPAILDRMTPYLMPPVLQDNSPAERTTAFADHHIPSRCTYYAIAAARHGVAVSFPLLDRRIVDFMLSLPVSQFLADGQSRQPYRRAMRDVLPDKVRLARHKVGLTDDRLLRYAGRKRDLLACAAALAADPPSDAAQIFDFAEIRQGLAALPEPDQMSAKRSGPPWLTLTAIQSLMIASWMSDAVPLSRTGPVT